MKRTILFGALALLAALTATARETYNFNSDWRINDAPRLNEKGKMKNEKVVTLPHAWNEDEAFKVSTYETTTAVVWYRKTFRLPAEADGKKVFVEFEGARQAAEVFLNGQRLGIHENGTMAFGFDLTPYINYNEDNLIEVRTDNDWKYKEQTTGANFQWHTKAFNVNYGGLPKNVWLHISDPVYQTLPLMAGLGTTGTYVYGTEYDVPTRTATIHVESQVKNDTDQPVTRSMNVIVEDMDGNVVARFESDTKTIAAHDVATLAAQQRVSGLHFWSWGYGYLYRVKSIVAPPSAPEGATIDPMSGSKTIEAPSGAVGGADIVTTVTGFRKTEFKNGMIYLNDRVMMVHGYAQRTTNEWPGVGQSVPAWMSDYSNDLFVKSGGNVVRWMHTCPWKQDSESCDRVGLIQAMPAGDGEHDIQGRRWEHRLEVMRDAIVYLRNSPSILFYECGNQRISTQHMREMKSLRNLYDPWGGRAIGCREMLDQPEAEYGGEMLYINKSDTKPMWMMEYCRDEGLRWYWNSWTYPYHQEGDGPLYREQSATSYNHNSDEFVAECVRRWYDYWCERPGSGTKVNSGGVKIVFSDTQSHGRSADNYRVSGVVDPMRIEKDAFYAHQVMWSGWVDDYKPQTYIVGHWNYNGSEKGIVKSEKSATADAFVVPTVYVVSNSDSVCLYQNDKEIKPSSHDFKFLWTYKDVKYESDKLLAISYNKDGNEESRYELLTAGKPDHLKLTLIENPTGWKADGNDLALVQIEVVDKDGRRCPLDNRLVKWTVKGPAEYLGGIAKGKYNHARQDTLPVECGVNRVMLRSLTKAGKIMVTAQAKGLPKASVELQTSAVSVVGGLATYKPSDGLKSRLDRGETPAGPSFRPWREEVPILRAIAASGEEVTKSYDNCENTSWESAGRLDSASVTYTLAEKTRIDEICMKLKNFRSTTYPLAVYAHQEKADGSEELVEVWRGRTPKSLGFVHLPLKNAPAARRFTIRMVGTSSTKDAFGEIKELDAANDEKKVSGNRSLKITEIEFLRNLK